MALEVFEEPEFQKNYLMASRLQVKSAVPRPVTPIYQNISTIVSTNLSPPANINPEQDATALNDAIQQAIEGKGILP